MATHRRRMSLRTPLVKKALKLEERGKKYRSSHDYNSASLCYSAACQALTGIGGSRSEQIRQKCGLALAECLYDSGQPLQCISVATTVISESSENNSACDICRAYYLRASSLHQIGMDQLCALDAERAFNSSSEPGLHHRLICKLLERVKHCLPIMGAARTQFEDVIDDITFSNSPRPATEDELSQLSENGYIMNKTLENPGAPRISFALDQPPTAVSVLLKVLWIFQITVSYMSGVTAIIKRNSALVSAIVTIILGLQILIGIIG